MIKNYNKNGDEIDLDGYVLREQDFPELYRTIDRLEERRSDEQRVPDIRKQRRMAARPRKREDHRRVRGCGSDRAEPVHDERGALDAGDRQSGA